MKNTTNDAQRDCRCLNHVPSLSVDADQNAMWVHDAQCGLPSYPADGADSDDAQLPPCRLCEKDFPRRDGVHYGTQSLGMIPATLCENASPDEIGEWIVTQNERGGFQSRADLVQAIACAVEAASGHQGEGQAQVSVNAYASPIRSSELTDLDFTSPAHVQFIEEGVVFDETHAIDFMCSMGADVLAAADGTVIEVINDRSKVWTEEARPPFEFMDFDEEDGNRIVLAHKTGEFTRYCHLAPNGSLLAVGDSVRQGQVIGLVGNTGWSLAPHLHFVVCKSKGEGFESLRTSITFASPAPVEGERCVNHCEHDPASIDPISKQCLVRVTLSPNVRERCPHRCAFSRPAPQTQHCSDCGYDAPRDAPYCARCGYTLSASRPASEAARRAAEKIFEALKYGASQREREEVSVIIESELTKAK